VVLWLKVRDARLAMTLLVLLAACTGGTGTTTYKGTKMDDFFPFDGERQATYVNEDASIPYQLEMELAQPSEQVGDREVWTLEYYEDQTFSLVAGVKWSVENGGSAQIHGWAGPDGSYVMYDPPIDATDPSGYMHVGDSVTTDSGGTTWTSTYVGNEDCPVQWGLDWENCVHLSISDGGAAPSSADPPSRPFFVGDYWLVTRYMTAWMHNAGYDQKWNLADYDYSAEG
jgi:hypothetical protein